MQEVGLDHTEEEGALLLVREEVEGANSAHHCIWQIVCVQYLPCVCLKMCAGTWVVAEGELGIGS